MRKVRDAMGLTNVELMIPFVRTVNEGEKVLAILKENGLERGKNGLKVVMMCEIPSNAILADEFLSHFDGFSIGSNDMTQLTLALDRDSGLVMEAFDERDAAVKRMLHLAIQACRKAGKYVGICGQGPSDYPGPRGMADAGGHRVDVPQPGHGGGDVAASREGGGRHKSGLMRARAGLLSGLCALASFDAFADPYAQVFGAIMLGVAAGFLACIVVELAFGRGAWYKRAAIGFAFAILDVVLYLVFLNVSIQVSIASGSSSPSNAGPVIVAVLAAWVVPAARLGWLLRRRPAPSA